ncbi:MAG: NifU family protein [Sedimentisphaerales bacterium]|nr:NifU family protein [Sedimentisphaerales bacterium]
MCEHCGCGDKDNSSVHQQVKDAIDQIRPYLQGHGGDIELVGVDPDNTVRVRLQGACSGCPGAVQTIKLGVERMLKQKVPQVKGVVAV